VPRKILPNRSLLGTSDTTDTTASLTFSTTSAMSDARKMMMGMGNGRGVGVGGEGVAVAGPPGKWATG